MGVLNDYTNAAAVNAALNKGVEANKAVSELKEDLTEISNEFGIEFLTTLNGHIVDNKAYSSSGVLQSNNAICTSDIMVTSGRIKHEYIVNLIACFNEQMEFVERKTVNSLDFTTEYPYVALMFQKTENKTFEKIENGKVSGVHTDILRKYKTVLHEIDSLKDLVPKGVETIEVGEGKDYTSFISALEYASQLTDADKIIINVYSGDYDIYAELGGDSFVQSISSTATWSDILPVLQTDVVINGIGDVTLRLEIPQAVYSAYTYQATRISTINNKGNLEVNNIHFVNKNCRYAIHDECDASVDFDGTTHVYNNCNIDSTNCSASIGVGMSTSDYVIKNCKIKNSTGNAVYMHNWSSGKGGNLTIENSVLDNGNSNGNGLKANVNGNSTIDIRVLSSFLKTLRIGSENKSIYYTNIFRLFLNKTNITEENLFTDEITSNPYPPSIYNY